MKALKRQTAKIFQNGRSQAVRLPAAFRFSSNEVYIWQDPETGHVILSSKPETWDDFFQLKKEIDIPEDFLSERDLSLPPKRDWFEG